MESQYSILIVLIPMFGALIATIVGLYNKKWTLPISIVSMAGSLWAALESLKKVLVEGPIHYSLGSWKPPVGIEYVVDHLNGIVLVLICTVSFLTLIYSRKGIEKEMPESINHFYVLFL